MIPLANRYTAVLDANVLFPNLKRDLLLCFFEADLYRARWTEEIQQEWLGHALTKYPNKAENLRRTDALMREHFDSAWVTGYERFIETVELPDRGDRHVVAAAIRCAAQYIVTDNLKDFPEDTLDELDLECGTADQFLASTFEHYEAQALDAIRDHRKGLRSDPSAPEYLMNLISKGLPLLAARLKPHQRSI